MPQLLSRCCFCSSVLQLSCIKVFYEVKNLIDVSLFVPRGRSSTSVLSPSGPECSSTIKKLILFNVFFEIIQDSLPTAALHLYGILIFCFKGFNYLNVV